MMAVKGDKNGKKNEILIGIIPDEVACDLQEMLDFALMLHCKKPFGELVEGEAYEKIRDVVLGLIRIAYCEGWKSSGGEK